MKKTISATWCLGLLMVLGCKKEPAFMSQPGPAEPVSSGHARLPENISVQTLAGTVPEGEQAGGDSLQFFTTYTIPAGQNYCLNNSYQPDSFRTMRFQAIFDSSCIYTSANPVNQYDINKLYGFADSATFHHQNSARFGWNWEGGAMHVHAYCYRSGIRESQELGTVTLNTIHDFSIEVKPGQYIFTLNGKQTIMQRSAQEPVALGYKLLPYFGGDEPAPHEVRIRIREFSQR